MRQQLSTFAGKLARSPMSSRRFARAVHPHPGCTANSTNVAQFSTSTAARTTLNDIDTPSPQKTPEDYESVEDAKPEKKKHKILAQADEELRAKLESMAVDGGAAGVEYENGKAEGLKRGVKNNMSRYI